MTGDPDIEPGAFGADHAHLCDHAATTFGTQGCPRWPACLTPGTGILRPAEPITDDEAVAFAQRWREAMAAGPVRADPIGNRVRATLAGRLLRWFR